MSNQKQELEGRILNINLGRIKQLETQKAQLAQDALADPYLCQLLDWREKLSPKLEAMYQSVKTGGQRLEPAEYNLYKEIDNNFHKLEELQKRYRFTDQYILDDLYDQIGPKTYRKQTKKVVGDFQPVPFLAEDGDKLEAIQRDAAASMSQLDALADFIKQNGGAGREFVVVPYTRPPPPAKPSMGFFKTILFAAELWFYKWAQAGKRNFIKRVVLRHYFHGHMPKAK